MQEKLKQFLDEVIKDAIAHSDGYTFSSEYEKAQKDYFLKKLLELVKPEKPR